MTPHSVKHHEKDKRAVVLLSGGLDSLLVVELGKRYGWEMGALFFDYSQRSCESEREASRSVARHYEMPWLEQEFPPGLWHQSSLHQYGHAPAPRTLEEIRQANGESPYVVPGRNGLFIQIAAVLARLQKCSTVLIGATLEDAAGFPDCEASYFEKLESILFGIKVRAPLTQMMKVEVVRTLLKLDAPVELTTTCYYAAPKPCGRCDACMIRKEAFEACGAEDPAC